MGCTVGLVGVTVGSGEVLGDLATGVKADLWSSSKGLFRLFSVWQFLSEKGVRLSGDIRARVKGPVVSALP